MEKNNVYLNRVKIGESGHMIIRKPYAFLIKNFKKIHIVLLLLSLFALYQMFDVSKFVSEYMRLGVYEPYSNPITNHITWFLSLSILIITVGTGALILLLRYKKKPWKVYLIPFIEYLVLFFVLNMIKSFFVGYTYDVETTDLRMSRDLLMVFQFVQLPAIAIFVMRVFGLDVQKFNFNSDKEFFELSEKDREEIEISLSVDHNTFIRLYKKLIRNIGYVYAEHTFICRIVAGIVGVILLYNAFTFVFITNRSYSQGSKYSVDGYTFKINNVYFTDKDNSGNVISKKSNFVILDLTVTNNSAPRKLYLDNFHLKNSSYDYVTTNKTYASDFKDIGDSYDSVKELKRDETLNFIIVYKVDNKLKKGRFVLYYQEESGYLRKISLKVKDISKIENKGTLNLGDDFTFSLKGNEQTVSFDSYNILDNVDYTYRICNTSRCYVQNDNYVTSEDYKVLKINFASTEFEGKDMVDFSSSYGKIVYIDSENTEEVVDIKYPFSHVATGKFLYVLIPNDAAESSKIEIVYTIRNAKYTYKIK